MKEVYEKVEDDFPSGWEEECLVSSVTTNTNGTLTIRIQIGVSSPDGRSWLGFRTVRLDREK